jgi:uncharacterized membrane protein YhaH (DUF805 family)
MRGEVLKPDDPAGEGVILGDDGQRYAFVTAQVHKSARLAAGDAVDFLPVGGAARDVYLPLPGWPMMAEAARTRERPVLKGPVKASPVVVYYLRTFTHNYARFNGRARRAEFWSFTLLSAAIQMLALYADIYISTPLYSFIGGYDKVFEPFFLSTYFAFTLIPSFAMLIRRLHDSGRYGWSVLMAFIPYVGVGWLFFYMIDDSQKEETIFGKSPKYSKATPSS